MSAERSGLVLNEDSSHFYAARSAEQMTLDGLHALVDQYADTQVSHLFLNPNSMRTSYRSAVWDSIFDQSAGRAARAESHGEKWIDNARLLDQRGLDPYGVWIARCREKQISPWISMRMNDVHNADDVDCPYHSRFWRQHPEYWRVPGSNGVWPDRSLDYAVPEVREYSMKLVRELLERYDADGLELDWMRFGYHFKPGHEAAGGEILRQFMRDVRALTQQFASQRGHPIKLAARVPTDPWIARGLGLDGVAWARDGLVDWLIPSPFWATADFDVPIELWRDLLCDANERVELCACLELGLAAYPGAKRCLNDAASARGFAASALHRGADRVYLFNYMDQDTTVERPEDYRAILTQAGQPQTLGGKARRHIVTYADTMPPGVATRQLLPATLEPIYPKQFRLHIGPAPKKAANAMLVVGLAEETCGTVTARINSIECERASDASGRPLPGAARTLRFIALPSALHDGYNLAELFLTEGPAGTVVWLELQIEGNR